MARVRTKTQPFHHAGSEPFDQTVGRCDERQRRVAIARRLQVKRDGAFAAIEQSGSCRQRPGGRIAAVNGDNIGAKIGKQHRRKRPRTQSLEFNDANAVQHRRDLTVNPTSQTSMTKRSEAPNFRKPSDLNLRFPVKCRPQAGSWLKRQFSILEEC